MFLAFLIVAGGVNTEYRERKFNMITIKLSNYYTFHITGLTDKQNEEIKTAMASATQFVMAGTRKCPIVKFYVENDIYDEKNAKQAFDDRYDGKGFEASYGLIYQESKGTSRYDKCFLVVQPTATMLDADLWKKDVIPECRIISIELFNEWASGYFKFEKINYVSCSEEKPTHMIKFNSMPSFSANYPFDKWMESVPLHYFANELNSNLRWRSKNGGTYDVVRFWDEKKCKVIYFADVYEHNPSHSSLGQRNFLFKRVSEKDIFLLDE